jgi:predicted lipoprotein with Yx(FWY)xxD motif
LKRTFVALLGAAVVALVASGLAGAAAPHRATLKLHNTDRGMILVNGRARTLYAFTRDRRNTDKCKKISGCLQLWPAVTTSGKPIAGPGVNAHLIGTIPFKHGVRQVTYAGHPLYTYANDFEAAQTSYVNVLQFGGRWPAVNAAGKEVK